jgi:PhnB protein
VSNVTHENPGVVPMLAYADGAAALKWLTDVFGFEEQLRMMDGDHLSQGVMNTDFGRIMLASGPPDYEGPLRHSEHCIATRAWMSAPWVIDGVLVYVKDLMTHHRHARDRGARILTEPETDFPGLRYRVEDLEGHRWMFMERQA